MKFRALFREPRLNTAQCFRIATGMQRGSLTVIEESRRSQKETKNGEIENGA